MRIRWHVDLDVYVLELIHHYVEIFLLFNILKRRRNVFILGRLILLLLLLLLLVLSQRGVELFIVSLLSLLMNRIDRWIVVGVRRRWKV